jgi:hypothetical protein
MDDVVSECGTNAPPSPIPASIEAELRGKRKVRRGATQRYELRLVNHASEAVGFAFAMSCGSRITAANRHGRDVIRSEHSDPLISTAYECDGGDKRTVAVTLEPGGSLVEALEWKAIGERWLDDKLLRSGPLHKGKYTLTARTWLTRKQLGGPGRGSGGYIPVTASLAIKVR